jgi:Ca2+:H+ antiporter
VFVGVFVVAILGNAAEHATAISAAMKDRMDLALSIAIGSSVQVALFVAPVLVFASLFLGPAPMDLAFPAGLVLLVFCRRSSRLRWLATEDPIGSRVCNSLPCT